MKRLTARDHRKPTRQARKWEKISGLPGSENNEALQLTACFLFGEFFALTFRQKHHDLAWSENENVQIKNMERHQ